MASSRLSKILRDLDRHRTIMDLDRDDLGERLLDSTMEVTMRDFDHAVSPDGTPWPPLSPAYFAWKQRYALTTAMGYKEGVMATEDNFRGQRFISAREARSAFGTDEVAKEECDHFSQSRPFIGISIEANVRSEAILTQHLNKNV